MGKIDTQGMSGEAVKGCMDNIYPKDENGNPIYPPGNFKELPIFSDRERKEIKEIMIEALHEWESQVEYLGRQGYKWENNRWVPTEVRPYRLDELQE
tara:strand:+ start:2096 stop:2386 length:291 start_codon:yes stop_codon:yes gene_type:complete